MSKQPKVKLHELGSEELRSKLQTLRQELAQSVLQKHAGKLKNVRLCSSKKDEIARVMTALQTKTLQEMNTVLPVKTAS